MITLRRIAVAAVTAVAIAGCGNNRAADIATQPKTMSVSGTLALYWWGSDGGWGDRCWGFEGYSSIREGAPVIVRDAKGIQLSLGALGAGTSEPPRTSEDPEEGVCNFTFTLQDIPVRDGMYSVEVAGRGQVTFSREEASNVQLEMGREDAEAALW